jgi:hypothetical protein
MPDGKLSVSSHRTSIQWTLKKIPRPGHVDRWTFTCSVFTLTQLLFTRVLTSALAVILINLYPLVAGLSHAPLLNFPFLCLHCLAILKRNMNWYAEHLQKDSGHF